MKMLDKLMGFPREYRSRVRRDEVIECLSYGIWKTRNRILEEVAANRLINGEDPLLQAGEAYWFVPKADVRIYLTSLLIREVVESKRESELTDRDQAWASRSDSSADEIEAERWAKNDFGELIFYKFLRGGVRKNEEEEDSLIAVQPVWVRA